MLSHHAGAQGVVNPADGSAPASLRTHTNPKAMKLLRGKPALLAATTGHSKVLIFLSTPSSHKIFLVFTSFPI